MRGSASILEHANLDIYISFGSCTRLVRTSHSFYKQLMGPAGIRVVQLTTTTQPQHPFSRIQVEVVWWFEHPPHITLRSRSRRLRSVNLLRRQPGPLHKFPAESPPRTLSYPIWAGPEKWRPLSRLVRFSARRWFALGTTGV
jgi:hypothetical protein